MKRHRHNRRSGAVLVVTLVCLLIALSITASMIAETIARRVQLSAEGNARQAELLVRAGQGRAAARLAADDAYRGEQWSPKIGGVNAVIEIATEFSAKGATRVTVAATYPEGDPKAVRRSRVFMFINTNLSPEE
jgi:phosphoribosylformylglycinamidine (FGAM) synthase-like enzyme